MTTRSLAPTSAVRSLLPIATLALLSAGPLIARADDGAAAAQPAKMGRALLGAMQDAFVSVADELEPAVVTITARKTVRKLSTSDEENGFPEISGRPRNKAFRSQGTGSGVLVSPDGWIITNDHVVGGADRVTVKLHDGREFEGVAHRDYRSDLAVVKIEGGPFRAARLGDSGKVKVGQWAIAIGSPYKYEGTFSVGVISALDRQQEIRDTNGEGDGRLYPDMMQTDAAINPGNSGGPLINLDGEVIGINTAIETENGSGVGIGFAIPINLVRFVTAQLRAKGSVTYGYLGVEPGSITPKIAPSYKVDAGALVRAEPQNGSPAAKAGIHIEDVITQINEVPIRGERDFRIAVSEMPPGTAAHITLVRAGQEKTVDTSIGEMPAKHANHGENAPVMPSLGVEVAMLTPETATRVGLSSKPQGVVVKAVDSASSLSETEMQPGDVILKVNDTLTPTVAAFRKVASALRPGDTVRIVWQGKRYPDTIKRLTIVTID